MPNTASPREEQSSKCWRPPASRALSRLDDTQRPARTHESLQFRGNEHELTACSGEIRRCPRSRYQSAPEAKSSYRNRRVRGPFWCNPITLLDPRQPALTVGVRGPPGPAARVSQRGSTSARCPPGRAAVTDRRVTRLSWGCPVMVLTLPRYPDAFHGPRMVSATMPGERTPAEATSPIRSLQRSSVL